MKTRNVILISAIFMIVIVVAGIQISNAVCGMKCPSVTACNTDKTACERVEGSEDCGGKKWTQGLYNGWTCMANGTKDCNVYGNLYQCSVYYKCKWSGVSCMASMDEYGGGAWVQPVDCR